MIKLTARNHVAGYFLNKGLNYFWDIRDKPSLFKLELSKDLLEEQADLSFQDLHRNIGQFLQSIFGRLSGNDQDSKFSNKLKEIAKNLEGLVSGDKYYRKSAKAYPVIMQSIRQRFDKEGFKEEAYSYLSKRKYKENSGSTRVQSFRETRKLFIRNLVDRIADDIWPEENFNLYFLVRISLK